MADVEAADLALLLSGQVLSWRGEPLEGAEVTMDFPSADGEASGKARWTQFTDAEGRFVFHGGAEDWTDVARRPALTVKHPDHPVAQPPPPARGDFVRVVLEPFPILSGRVLMPNGLEPPEAARVYASVGGRELETLSQPGGVYRFEAVPVGRLESMWVRAKGAAKLEVEPGIEMIPGGAEYYDLHLRRGVVVTGTVLDADSGEPIAGASVWADAPEAEARGAGLSSSTDEKGRFRLEDVSPEEVLGEDALLRLLFELRARAGARSHGINLRYIAHPNEAHEYYFEIELRSYDATVRGVVVAPDETLFEGATVILCTDLMGPLYAKSDEKGGFRFDNAPRGDALLHAEGAFDGGWGRAQQKLELVSGAQDVDLYLERGEFGEVRGRVWMKLEHAPRAQVTADAIVVFNGAQTYAGRTEHAFIEADGHYAFKRLPPGTWNVYPNGPHFEQCSPESRLVELPPSVLVSNIDFSIEQPFEIEGRVLTVGYPAKLLTVELRDPADNALLASTRVNDQERFAIASDRAGIHRFIVRIGKNTLVDRMVGPTSIEGAVIELP